MFGKGPVAAPLILVGEQPGDVEDKRGIPFVGPAGAVLWQCLEDAGIDRDAVYTTNAVKHFKHETRGKRRLHKKPDTAEIEACHPWIDAELKALKGEVIVALGATAARSLLGRSVPDRREPRQAVRGGRPADDRHVPPVRRSCARTIAPQRCVPRWSPT